MAPQETFYGSLDLPTTTAGTKTAPSQKKSSNAKSNIVSALVLALSVTFFSGRAYGPTETQVNALVDTMSINAGLENCEGGKYLGDCTLCADCSDYEYDAGGCSYFSDRLCLRCEPVRNCKYHKDTCTTQFDSICTECKTGFMGDACVPCSKCGIDQFASASCTHHNDTECSDCTDCDDEYFIENTCNPGLTYQMKKNGAGGMRSVYDFVAGANTRSEEHTSELQSP